jgi:hypothetical protein
MLRSGGIPFASASLRAKSMALAAELDRVERLRAADDVSRNEARQLVATAIASFRRAAQSDASEQAQRRADVINAGARLQATVEARLAKLSQFDLELVRRRASQIEAAGVGATVSAPAMIQSRDMIGLCALALVQPAVGLKALAAVHANHDANAVAAGAATLRAAAAAEAAIVAADELAGLDQPWSDRHRASGSDMLVASVAPKASTMAPDGWPRWTAEFLDLADAAPVADASDVAPVAQHDGATAAQGGAA